MTARKSLKKKKLEGTVDSRRTAKIKKDKLGDVANINMQDYLGPEGMKMFELIKKHLDSNKAYYGIDDVAIRQAAFFFEQWLHTAKDIKDRGRQSLLLTLPTGHQQVSPLFTILAKFEEFIAKYYRMLGITPIAREKLRAFMDNSDDADSNPFAEDLNKLNGSAKKSS